MKLYIFRTVPLSIIRSFPLYTQQWYMSYRFADSCQQTFMTYEVYHCCVYSGKLVRGLKFLLKFLEFNIHICHPIFSQRPSTIFESYDTSEVPTLTVPPRGGSAGAVPTAADNNDGSVERVSEGDAKTFLISISDWGGVSLYGLCNVAGARDCR